MVINSILPNHKNYYLFNINLFGFILNFNLLTFIILNLMIPKVFIFQLNLYHLFSHKN